MAHKSFFEAHCTLHSYTKLFPISIFYSDDLFLKRSVIPPTEEFESTVSHCTTPHYIKFASRLTSNILHLFQIGEPKITNVKLFINIFL